MSYPCGEMHHDIIQGSDAWFAIKCAKASGSHMADVTMKKTNAGYRNYRAQLVSEALTGEVEQGGFCSGNMQDGIDLEPEGRNTYEFENTVEVVQVGFIDHPHIAMSGSSPDGLVGDDGGIEIKCVIPATHIDTMLNGTIGAKYMKQMQWFMACSGRLWCDFVSYSPKLGIDLQLHVIRIERDDKMIRELETETTLLMNDVSKTIEALKAIGSKPVTA